jgi:hypothetical protein
LLDEEAVGPSEDAPVEISQFVPGLISAMLGELNGKAAKRRAMNTRQEPLDDAFRHDFDAAETGDIRGVQQI